MVPRYRASNVQMSEWKFTYIRNECSHYSPKATNPMIDAPKRKACPTYWAVAVYIWLHFLCKKDSYIILKHYIVKNQSNRISRVDKKQDKNFVIF